MRHTDGVSSVAFTPDGQGLISGSGDRTLKYWDLGPLLKSAQREAALRQSYEVGVRDVGSVAYEEGGQNEGVCVVRRETSLSDKLRRNTDAADSVRKRGV